MPLYVWRLVRNGAPGVMPNRALFFYTPAHGRRHHRCIGILFRSSAAPLLVPLPPPSLPARLSHPVSLPPVPSPRRVFFFQAGEKMRAARRLVEGTDDVVSDVPPPGTLGGGDARMRDDGERARGRVRAPPPRTGGCIYRGGCCSGYRTTPRGGRGAAGGRRGEGPSLELDGNIITSEKPSRDLTRAFNRLPRLSCGLSPLRPPPPSSPRTGNRGIRRVGGLPRGIQGVNRRRGSLG